MGLLTRLCIRRPYMLIYNSSFLLRLNVCNDLTKAIKALDGKKASRLTEVFPRHEDKASSRGLEFL